MLKTAAVLGICLVSSLCQVKAVPNPNIYLAQTKSVESGYSGGNDYASANDKEDTDACLGYYTDEVLHDKRAHILTNQVCSLYKTRGWNELPSDKQMAAIVEAANKVELTDDELNLKHGKGNHEDKIKKLTQFRKKVMKIMEEDGKEVLEKDKKEVLEKDKKEVLEKDKKEVLDKDEDEEVEKIMRRDRSEHNQSSSTMSTTSEVADLNNTTTLPPSISSRKLIFKKVLIPKIPSYEAQQDFVNNSESGWILID